MKSRDRYLAIAVVFFSTGVLPGLQNYFPAAHAEERSALGVSYPHAMPAEFRGCESARACRFRIESLAPLGESSQVVRPSGLSVGTDRDALAVRDRLNSLLSNMIHQHKRIELQDLRKLDDGAYVAKVMVNGMDVSEDPILNDLMETSRK